MPEVGELALWTALPISIWGTVLAFAGAAWGRGELVLSAERSVQAVFGLLLVACVGLGAALLGDRFEFAYVHLHSGRPLEPVLKLTALRAGAPGFLLLWTTFLGAVSTVVVWRNRKRHRTLMPWATGTLLAVSTFLLVVLLFAALPFERLAFAPADGHGLHPDLQSLWMPGLTGALLLGLALLAVPFALATAALLTGRVDGRWVDAARPWGRAAWIFLTAALVMTLRWAYEDPGRSAGWFREPVDGGVLLPWIVATAWLHCAGIRGDEGRAGLWTTGFAGLGVPAAALAAALAVPIDGVAVPLLLALAGASAGVFLVLLVMRLPVLRAGGGGASWRSREGALLAANALLLVAFVAAAWGPLGAVIAALTGGAGIPGAVGAEAAALDPVRPVTAPVATGILLAAGLLSLLLMAVGPALAHRRANLRRTGAFLLPPAVVAVAVVGTLALFAVSQAAVLFGVGVGVFAAVSSVLELGRAVVARRRIRSARGGVRPGGAGAQEPPRAEDAPGDDGVRWGFAVVHLGTAVAVLGLAGAGLGTETRESVRPGGSITATSPLGNVYTLRYQGLSTHQARNAWEIIALLTLERPGRPAVPVTSSTRFLLSPPGTVTTAGIRSFLLEDLYLSLEAVEGAPGPGDQPTDEPATFRVRMNSFVPWIWVGGGLAVTGMVFVLLGAGMGAPPAPVSNEGSGQGASP